MEAQFADNNFISLKDAARLCNHSQDYLNLLVRKGYLRAVKIGRNWVTTPEWTQDYLQRIARKRANGVARKEALALSKINNAALSSVESVIENGESEKRIEKLLPPFPKNSALASLTMNRRAAWVCLILCAAAAIGVIIFTQREMLSAGINVVFTQLATAERSIQGAARFVSEKNLSASLERAAGKVKIFFVNLWRDRFSGFFGSLFFGRTEIVKVSETSSPGIDRSVLEGRVNALEQDLTGGARRRINEFRTEFGLPAQSDAQSLSQGLVVLPLLGDENKDDEMIKEKIKESFSDRVIVAPEDQNYGIITPQFKDVGGGEYMYMLVPLEQNNF